MIHDYNKVPARQQYVASLSRLRRTIPMLNGGSFHNSRLVSPVALSLALSR